MVIEKVSAVIVTRGNVDLSPILESLPFRDIVVWDNYVEQDVKVFGRYAALSRVMNDVIYVQDDDCIVSDVAALLRAYEPGVLVANMPKSRWSDYPDSALVGWGAIFDRGLPELAFERFRLTSCGPMDTDFFYRTCDVVFSTLTPHHKIDTGFSHLSWAEGSDRMFKQPDHKRERDEMLDWARTVRVS